MCQGLMDKMWQANMSEAEVVNIMKKCIVENKKRFLVVSQAHIIKVVDKNGIRTVYSGDKDCDVAMK